MLCRHVQSYLDDYILSQIDKELADKIDNHLKECLDCQKRLEGNKQLFTVLKSLPTPDPGDYYWQQMEDSILAATVGENRQNSKLPEQAKTGPIGLMQRYLIPLTATFLLFLGSLYFANPVQNPILSGVSAIDSSSSYIMAEKSEEISDRSDSHIFTAIVASAPGSLGRYLIFADINGGTR
ncbi:MAG: hypothetical protein DRP51_08650 [Candidatus Zixiibacteriota bacterium]|nr:MAG: hypothetical protein DRP51_08650 [candidate division Zixibacteria bacterium]HHI03418.1 zf-HC2 domain-containing protein [candidate division Zixibacteria bacterium]